MVIDKIERERKLAWGIAYCLAYDRGMNETVMERLRQLVAAEPMPQGSPNDEVSLVAEAARLITHLASDEAPPLTKEVLQNSRLNQLNEQLNAPCIALVMGGATKIKQYVFESAKLPEIRGASGLLDRINLHDVPTLFSQEPYWLKELRGKVGTEKEELDEAERLVKQIREGFQAHYAVEPPDCEECIIYANGGEVLAFAPLKLTGSLTEAIEHLYTRETLTANSVAVWRSCSLTELRFGLRPLEFWTDELTACLDESLQELLRDYYGELDPQSFLSRKTFGEVAAALALEKLRRRDGNKGHEKTLKPAPHFETTPYTRRCQSCERRNAVVEGPRGVLCEPCARKRVFGQKAKKETPTDRQWFDRGGFAWEPLAAKAWGARFEEWLSDSGRTELAQGYYHKAPKDKVYPARDLDDIAAAAQPEGFIGIVYADGNNMGALLEKLRTPADYQEFAERVYQATIAATFTALATHLYPHKQKGQWLHPFEVLSIGGDDVLLIVPGHTALPIAVTIAKRAEKQLSQHCITQESYQWRQIHRINPPSNWQPPAVQSQVSLSSGVVIADQHTPIFFLQRLAEELLKSAKAKAKRLRDSGFYGATIDFLALKSIGMIATNIRAFRESALQRGKLHLTAKPYTVPELHALLQAVKTFKQADFPKSQIYRLRAQLEKGWLASTVDYLYLQSRSSDAKELRRTLDDVWIGTEQHGRVSNIGLWLRRDENEWETILSDSVEIYDFVSEKDLFNGE